MTTISFIRRLTLFLVLIIASTVAMSACRVGEPTAQYSTGYRVGKLEKFSRKGLIYKTYEGRLILQGYDRDDKGNMVIRTFDFSVLPKDTARLVPQLDSALDRNAQVRLHYNQDVYPSQWRYDSSYFVDRVDVVQ